MDDPQEQHLPVDMLLDTDVHRHPYPPVDSVLKMADIRRHSCFQVDTSLDIDPRPPVDMVLDMLDSRLHPSPPVEMVLRILAVRYYVEEPENTNLMLSKVLGHSIEVKRMLQITKARRKTIIWGGGGKSEHVLSCWVVA